MSIFSEILEGNQGSIEESRSKVRVSLLKRLFLPCVKRRNCWAEVEGSGWWD